MNTSPTGAYARPVYCIHVGMQVLCSGLLLLCSGLLLLCLGLLLLSLYVTMGQYIVPGSWNNVPGSWNIVPILASSVEAGGDALIGFVFVARFWTFPKKT